MESEVLDQPKVTIPSRMTSILLIPSCMPSGTRVIVRLGRKADPIVYRPQRLARAPRGHTAERWRARAREAGLPGLFLVAAKSFDMHDPRPFGFDAAVDFPPHQVAVADITSRCEIINPQYRGQVP